MKRLRSTSLLAVLAALLACQASDPKTHENAARENAAAPNNAPEMAAAAPDAALAGMTRLGGASIQGWIDATRKWPNFRNIPVCWEQSGSAAEKEWVRDAIEQSWDANSSVGFTGWGDCTNNAPGIHIMFEDRGAYTQGLGTDLNRVRNGMHLNFTMHAWNPGCVQHSGLEACIRMVAIHEFGHALGFAHEQNRSDTPGQGCAGQAQGDNGTVMLTPWDEHSIMNYCNPVYNNAGQLSPGDISSVQQAYGADA